MKTNPSLEPTSRLKHDSSKNIITNQFNKILLLKKNSALAAKKIHAQTQQPLNKKIFTSHHKRHHHIADLHRKKHENTEDKPVNIFVEQHLQFATHHHDPHALAHASVASGRADEINRLIKKLTINLNTNDSNVDFSISEGIFLGAQFSLQQREQQLHITICDAPEDAKSLLLEHQSELKKRLHTHEINLSKLSFI